MTESPRKLQFFIQTTLAARKKRQRAQGFHDLARHLVRFIGIAAGRFQDFMGKFIRAFRQGGKDAGSLFTHHSFVRTENEVNGLLL